MVPTGNNREIIPHDWQDSALHLGYGRLSECLDPWAEFTFNLAASRGLVDICIGILCHCRVAVQDIEDLEDISCSLANKDETRSFAQSRSDFVNDLEIWYGY